MKKNTSIVYRFAIRHRRKLDMSKNTVNYIRIQAHQDRHNTAQYTHDIHNVH